MKITDWRFVACLLVCALLAGEHESTAQFSIGPRVGLNRAAFTIDNQAPGTTNSSFLGTILGAVAEFPVNGILSVRVEPCYIQKGTTVDLPGEPAVETQLRSRYFQMPIELNASLPIPFYSPHIFAGPNPSYLLSAKESSNTSSGEIDAKNRYTNFDFALDFGAGLDYSIMPLIHASLDLKYSLGLSNIDKTNSSAIHTRGFQALLGVLFGL